MRGLLVKHLGTRRTRPGPWGCWQRRAEAGQQSVCGERGRSRLRAHRAPHTCPSGAPATWTARRPGRARRSPPPRAMGPPALGLDMGSRFREAGRPVGGGAVQTRAPAPFPPAQPDCPHPLPGSRSSWAGSGDNFLVMFEALSTCCQAFAFWGTKTTWRGKELGVNH